MRKRRFTRWCACAAMLSLFAAQQVLAQTFTAGQITGQAEVGLHFSEPMHADDADDETKYTVAGVTVTTAFHTDPLGQVVILILNSEAAPGAQVTVSGVRTAAGISFSGSVAAEVYPGTQAALGTPVVQGFGNYLGGGSYMIESGGNDIWGTADDGHFISQEATGAFQAVGKLDQIAGTHQWAKAGLMARETPDAGSRYVMAMGTRPNPDSRGNADRLDPPVAVSNGQNQLYMQWRDTTDGGSGNSSLTNTVTIPVWAAVARWDALQNVFLIAFDTSDTPPAQIADWEHSGFHTIPGDLLPDALQVGPAGTSHENSATGAFYNELMEAVFTDLEIQPYTQAVLAAEVTDHPDDVLSVVGSTVSFSVQGNYAFAWPTKWLVNDVEVDPTQTGYTFSLATTADHKDAEVKAVLTGSDGVDVTSDVAIITLDDPQTGTFVAGTVLLWHWDNIAGTTPGDLLNHERYPADFDSFTFHELPDGTYFPSAGDTYGRVWSGVFMPPTTGDYDFFTKSDDSSQVYISDTEASPIAGSRDPDAWLTGWTADTSAWLEVGAGTSTTATPFPMTAGQPRGITGLLKEGGGGDYMRVTTRLSGTALPAPDSTIPAAQIGYMINSAGRRLTVTQQPQDVETAELVPTTFTVEATTQPELGAWDVVTWEIDEGSTGTWVEIPGASGSPYEDAGRFAGTHLIRGKVFWLGGEEYTEAATYEVMGGTPVIEEQPQMSAGAVGGSAEFTVVADSDLWPARWFVDGVEVDPSQTGHTFVYSPVQADADIGQVVVTVQLGASEVVTSDDAILLVDNAAPEQLTQGFLKGKKYNDLPGVRVYRTTVSEPHEGDLYNADKFIAGAFDEELIITGFDFLGNAGDNYGALFEGYVVLPDDGEYYWMIRSDDGSELAVNPSGGTEASLPTIPALNKDTPGSVLTATEYDCCGPFQEPETDYQPTDPLHQIPGVLIPPFVANWDPATSPASIPHLAGMYYGAAFSLKEGGGGDWGQVTARMVGDDTPAADMLPLGPAAVFSMHSPAGHRAEIGMDPADDTVNEGELALFTVGVDVLPMSDPFGVQWQVGGVNIPGETGTNLQFTVVRADNGKQYRAQIFALTGEELYTTAATLTVIEDNDGPVIVGAGALPGSLEVGINFDEPIDVNSATNPANYTVAGATVTGAEIRSLVDGSRTGEAIVLTCSGTPANGAAIAAPGVTDLYGNASTTSGSIELGVWTSTLLGPATAGGGVYMGNDAVHIAAAGNDIWNASDAGTYVYQQYTGAFEITGKMEIMDNAANNWSKVGLMVRETLDAGSRNVMTVITSEDGNNLMSMQWRAATDGTSSSTPNAAVLNPDGSQVQRQTPAWWPSDHKLVRRDATANVFEVYYSQDDRVTWVKFGEYDMGGDPLPETVYVGVVSTSHVSDTVADAFSNVSELSIGEPIAVEAGTFMAISAAGGNVTVTWEGDGELRSAPAVDGPYTGLGETDGDYEGPATADMEIFQLQN